MFVNVGFIMDFVVLQCNCSTLFNMDSKISFGITLFGHKITTRVAISKLLLTIHTVWPFNKIISIPVKE